MPKRPTWPSAMRCMRGQQLVEEIESQPGQENARFTLGAPVHVSENLAQNLEHKSYGSGVGIVHKLKLLSQQVRHFQNDGC